MAKQKPQAAQQPPPPPPPPPQGYLPTAEDITILDNTVGSLRGTPAGRRLAGVRDRLKEHYSPPPPPPPAPEPEPDATDAG